MNSRNFSDLGLAEPIQRALNARKHVIPTPIQAQAIPQLLIGKDLLGIAQTGTGKTAAFALPILHQLSEARHGQTQDQTQGRPKGRNHRKGQGKGPHEPRALILAPTRELAIQIGEEFGAYGKDMRLRHTVIFGGVSQKPQVNALRRGVDIVVATPGRLLDLMNQRQIRLDTVVHFVLDEADRMLDMGFVRDVRKIISALPKVRQSQMFSATMPGDIARLSREILNDPVRVEVTPQATPVETIEQNVYHVPAGQKLALLTKVLNDSSLSRVIVFARTKHRANRIAIQLGQSGVSADAIHGNKSQNARQLALKRFRDGKARVLVATDIAARGIDVDGISHVINFELPNEPESYVHRIGRTARAGADGVALSFCDSAEREHLRGIECLIQRRLTVIGEGPAEETSPRSQNKNKKPGKGRGQPWRKRRRSRPSAANGAGASGAHRPSAHAA